MNEMTPVTQKEAWVAPAIETLDVGETYRFNRFGNDAGPYADATRS